MSKSYRKFKTTELIKYFREFRFTRKLKQLHIHNTYLPDHSNFKGDNHDELNANMENYHVNVKNWSDIGQHLTLFPDGLWLLGRDLNRTPASILGWNTGAICIEMLGNFNIGHDKLISPQEEAVYELCEFLVETYGVAIKFHRDNPTAGNKTCPGTSIDKDDFCDKVINFTENNEEVSRSQRLKDLMESVEVHFTDMIDPKTGKVHWANDFVNYLYEKKVIVGNVASDGSKVFRPNDPITRAEVCTIIAKAMESIEETIHRTIKDFDGDLFDSKRT